MARSALLHLSSSLQFLLFPSLFMLYSLANAQPLTIICSTSNYTANSPYQTNLNLLLHSLSSNASISGFYNTTVGESPDQVHGLALCRGDVTRQTCRTCVDSASQEIRKQCPNNKAAIIWYDQCQLRYSNLTVISLVDNFPSIRMLNINNISNPTVFDQLLEGMLKNLSSKAAFSPSTRLFATLEANFNASQKIYSLAQCTPDLSRNDCNKCLQGAITNIQDCCGRKQGGRILGTSCNLRFEFYQFYANSRAPAYAPAIPPTAPPPPSTPPAVPGGPVPTPSDAKRVQRKSFKVVTLLILFAFAG